MPGQPPAWSPGQPSDGSPGQSTDGSPGQSTDGSPGQSTDGSSGQPAGAAPGQQYGAYRPHPGASRGAPGYGTPRYGTGGQTAKDPVLAEWWQRLLARLVDDVILVVLTSP